MNSFETTFDVLVKFLSKEKIKYAIVGGLAVSLYGEPRLTLDIDANVIFDKSDITEFLNKARKYGFTPLLKNAKSLAKETGVIPLKFIKGKITGRADVILAENILEYQAIKRSRIKKINSIKAKLITPEDLIIHKITSARPKDLEDLNGILIRQRNKLDINYIRQWLRRIDRENKRSRLSQIFNNLLKSG